MSLTPRVLALLLAALALVAHGPATAQSVADAPRPVTPDEYGRFEQLQAPSLSPDGTWLAYVIRTVDEDEELRVRPLDRDTTRTFVWGSSPDFSPDGLWLAWTIGVSPDERERLERENEPIRTDAGILELRTGAERTYPEVRARSFDATGRYAALHGYAPEEPRGKGADLRVVELASGTEISFGNVATFAWSDTGSLLALAIATGSEEGNGVQLYDAATGGLRALDGSGSAYRHLAWREDAADLAALRSVEPMAGDSTPHALLAWRGLDGASPERLRLDPQPAGVADSLRVVGFAGPRWSSDGSRLSFGLRPGDWDEADAPAEPDPAPGDTIEAPRGNDDVELPGVQIWHSSDVLIHPQQRAREATRRRATLLAVWTPADDRVVQIGTDLTRTTSITDDWRFGIERDLDPYPWGRMFGRAYEDVWTVDLDTGARDLRLREVRYAWVSSGGRYLLSFDGSGYRALDLHTGTEADLTADLPAEFANTEYDTPTDMLPPHGVGGWIGEDEAVLLYDRFDVWRVAPDGSGGERLTDGGADEVIHRVLRVPAGPGALDADLPLYLSLREEPTERRGFARIPPGAAPQRLALEDAMLSGLVRADSADVFLFRSEARHVSPDLWVAGPDLANPRRLTRTNPFLDDFAWTRAELLHFDSEAGVPLKGVLLYPADHDPSRVYPMIVYTYERLSQGMHQFQVPSERSYYNFTAWTQHGYFVLLPDIVYRARDPGVSAIEAVRPAIGAVVDRGLVDPARVGLIGHSWGGYQATYLPTRTNLFAASVAGAPLTDFVNFMGQIHWSGGNPEVTHWETGQARMEVPFWEDPEAHERNSPLHEVHNMETPLLMAFGDDDGVVEWWQGTVFYNFARRAGRHMVLLVYEGEGHGFSQKPNQIDYHRRILEWFGHYLQGDPAPAWVTDGVAIEDLEDETRRVASPPSGDGGAGG